MDPSTHGPECDAFHDDLASLAVGSLTGVDRARVLAHLEECSHCTDEVEELAAAADALCTLIPDATPPAGFSDRTMALIRADRSVPRRPATRRLVAAAAVVVLVAVGVGLGLVISPPGRNDNVPTAAAVRTSTLHSSVGTRGTVLLVSSGHRGWLVMSLHDAPTSGIVTCSVTLTDGSQRDLGQFALLDGYGSWSVVLPVAASTVRTVSVVGGTGAMIASAQVR
jgi:hypothetical protein